VKRILDKVAHVLKGLMNPNMKKRKVKEDYTQQIIKVKGIKQFQKASMENYGPYAKSLYRSIDQMNLQRAQSARPVKIKGLKYQFKLIDLGKYHDTKKYGVFNWPVQYCTIGKKIPNPVERKNALVKEIHFDTLLRVLKQTDWAKAPLFQMFKNEGRWVHQDESIYSEIELKYLCSSLAAMVNAPNYEEFNQDEGLAIIEKHWSKTVHTLEVLMNQMNMMYYFQKLRL